MAYSHLDDDFDPWDSVEDLDGDNHYKVLEVRKNATPEQLKLAYRKQARIHHPDKGGDANRFAAIQKAWEVSAGETLNGCGNTGHQQHH